jgi:dimethylhistidine N-methyltransferase
MAEGGGPAPENVAFHDLHPALGDSRAEALAGLRAAQKRVDPKHFYDAHGSRLFEAITRLPEYYPTRTETAILRREARAIAGKCGTGSVLIEPGSGNCEKVQLLLDALRPAAYVPLDISAAFLCDAAAALGEAFPWLPVRAICADFNAAPELDAYLPPGRRLIFYPGSTIGNLEPPVAQDFLRRLAGWVGEDGGALIGVDLHKDAATLERAYNDSAGVTAAFNLNALNSLNRLLEADFDPAAFSHRAFYNAERQRIEMHLVSHRDQVVHCAGEPVAFAEGETLHTENSYKYTIDGFAHLAAGAGLAVREHWVDPDRLFSVHYLERG